MTSSQLAEWLAYASIEPFGEYRSEIRHGQQMALTRNLNRNPKTRPAPYVAADFMNFIEKPPSKQKKATPAELSQRIKFELFNKTG